MKGPWAAEFTFRWMPSSFEWKPFWHFNFKAPNGSLGYFGWLSAIFNWTIYRQRVLVVRTEEDHKP